MNNCLLSDEVFQRALSTCLRDVWSRRELSVFQIWDLFRQEIKNVATEASARIAFLKRHHLRELGRTLIELHELRRMNSGAYFEDINNVKAQLQQFPTERCKGASIRSRSRRFLDGQPYRRALSDERATALAKEILKIQYGGCTYSDTAGILNAFFCYYPKPVGSCEGINLG